MYKILLNLNEVFVEKKKRDFLGFNMDIAALY